LHKRVESLNSRKFKVYKAESEYFTNSQLYELYKLKKMRIERFEDIIAWQKAEDVIIS